MAIDIQPVGSMIPTVNTQRATDGLVLPLIQELCHGLVTQHINYCHWKSNNALERSASGDNDLDLLVSRADMQRFTKLLLRLGFKKAQAPAEKAMPDVFDYFGYDKTMDKFVHAHVHYQLVLGHDMSKNYHLPIEKQYLESAVQGELFRVPAPEFEFIVFVIRMALKHLTWDAILGREGTLSVAEQQELAYLQARISQHCVHNILQQHLPSISSELFDNCVRALQSPGSTWMRVKIGRQLQTRLQANARRSVPVDVTIKLLRRVALAYRRRLFKSTPKYRLYNDGALIAVVGGDGAGKSTAVDAVHSWLAQHFETTKIHMGKPAWSWTTIAVRGILKVGQLLGLYPVESSFYETLYQQSIVSPGYPWLLREACRARDRYRTYLKARRFAANGGLVILDRFPVSQIQLMDGPQAGRFVSELKNRPQGKELLRPHQASRLTNALVKLEKSYYHQIMLPDLLIVLRVDPEIAVRRKTDENPGSVRERNTEIWNLNWEQTHAYVIDGSKSKADVLAELKTHIWSQL